MFVLLLKETFPLHGTNLLDVVWGVFDIYSILEICSDVIFRWHIFIVYFQFFFLEAVIKENQKLKKKLVCKHQSR
jgi:hypothetical protein